MKSVCVHNGVCHADEAMAVAIYRTLDSNCHITRTRDPKVISDADIVFDVGMTYDPSNNRFDHHQWTNRLEISNYDELLKLGAIRPHPEKKLLPYSSAGLAWKHFGEEILKRKGITNIPKAFHRVDKMLIQGIDLVDTGLASECDSMTISDYISSFNSHWFTDQHEDHAFHAALDAAKTILSRTLAGVYGEDLAVEDVNKSFCNRQNPQILILERFCPWVNAIFDLDTDEQVKYAVFPAKEGGWRVQCVPVSPGSFKTRLPLPVDWAGLRDKELQDATGVDDAVFVHGGRFIGGAESKEGALALANLAVLQ